MKKNKPIYKRWWFWLGAFLLFGLIIGLTSNDEEVAETKTKEEQQPNEEEQPKEDKEEKPQKKKIDINEEIKIGNVNIDLKSVTLEGDKLSVFAWWFHGAGREKIHFSVLATMSALQDGEYLEVTDGEDTLLRKTDYGVDSNIDIEYQLIDDKTPVEIRFRTTTDDPEEEIITVDIK